MLERETDQKILFFFCSRDDIHRCSATAVLRGLIYQAIGQGIKIPEQLENDLKEDQRSCAILESPVELERILVNMLRNEGQNTPQTWVIIDGLDECSTESIMFLTHMCRNICFNEGSDSYCATAQFLIVSRKVNGFLGIPTIDLEDTVNKMEIASDVELYLKKEVASLQAEGLDLPALEQIRSELARKSDGNFLWLSITFHDLRNMESKEAMFATIRKARSGLFLTYDRILENIPPEDREICRKILHWIALAMAPPGLIELATAIGLNDQNSIDSPDLESVMKHEIAKCGQLLQYQISHDTWGRRLKKVSRGNNEVEDTDNSSLETVVFMHQSIRDYILQEHSSQETNDLKYFWMNEIDGHCDMAVACLTYLKQSLHKFVPSFTITDSGIRRSIVIRYMRGFSDYFFYYATTQWPIHVRSCGERFSEVFSRSPDMFEERSILRYYWSVWFASLSGSHNSPKAAYNAGKFGLTEWAKLILKDEKLRKRKRDEIVRLMMRKSIQYGQKGVVAYLLDKHLVSSSERLSQSKEGLVNALHFDQPDIAKFLIKANGGMSLYQKSLDRNTIKLMEQPEYEGAKALSELLIDDHIKNSQSNQDKGSWMWLRFATQKKYSSAVEKLLTWGVPVEAPKELVSKESSLFNAYSGHAKDEKCMLAFDAEKTMVTLLTYGNTPRTEYRASPFRRLFVDISPNYEDVLVNACRLFHLELTKLVLQRGVDPNPGMDSALSHLASHHIDGRSKRRVAGVLYLLLK